MILITFRIGDRKYYRVVSGDQWVPTQLLEHLASLHLCLTSWLCGFLQQLPALEGQENAETVN